MESLLVVARPRREEAIPYLTGSDGTGSPLEIGIARCVHGLPLASTTEIGSAVERSSRLSIHSQGPHSVAT